MNYKKIIQTLHPLEIKVINVLKDCNSLTEILQKTNLKDIEVMRALQWLENKNILKIKKVEHEFIDLDINGIEYSKNGLPEKRLLKELKDGDKSLNEIKSLSKEEIGISIGSLKKKAAIEVIDGKLKLNSVGQDLIKNDSLEELFLKKPFPISVSELKSEEIFAFENLKSRKSIIKTYTQKNFLIELSKIGHEFTKNEIKLEDSMDKLTPEIIKSGEWKNKKFRHYDITSKVPEISGGRRHPANEVNNLIRNVFLSMGFKEMEGPLVESAFWCMDSMWIPQDHPARDVQDTFFVEGVADLPEKYVEKVKSVHENGGDTGSKGYQKTWEESKAKQLILRTHSTAATFRKFGEGINEDCKFFYIATNFRNEATDATHLAEFVQIEGFVMGDDLGLPHLMGLIKDFYSRLGINKIRFKPTYNPYTEPSMEAHYYDENKKKWYALINSGIFRPESLAPYGIKKSVIAWGMGGTRIAALLNKVKSPKDMVGSGVNFEWIQKHQTPQPRLD